MPSILKTSKRTAQLLFGHALVSRLSCEDIPVPKYGDFVYYHIQEVGNVNLQKTFFFLTKHQLHASLTPSLHKFFTVRGL